MSERELFEKYNKEWQCAHPKLFTAWLLSFFFGIAMMAVAGFLMIRDPGEESLMQALIFFVIFVIAMGVATAIRLYSKKGWKAYLEAHRHEITK